MHKIRNIISFAAVFFIVFTLGCISVLAADSGYHDLTFELLPVDENGDPWQENFPYTYDVTITLSDSSGNPVTGDYTVTTSAGSSTVTFDRSGAGTVTVASGTPVTVEQLPEGTNCHMTSSNVHHEDVTIDEPDIVLDSDKDIHVTVRADMLYTTFNIHPVNYLNSWPSDTEFRFTMEFRDSWNTFDSSRAYYTISGDPTHYPFTYTSTYVYRIEEMIPIDSVLTLHNIPVGISFGSNDYTSSEEYNIFWNGQRMELAGSFFETADYHYIMSSGVIERQMTGTWTIYLTRESTFFFVTKTLNGPEAMDLDEIYDFRITLYDYINDRPYTEPVMVAVGPVNDVYNNIYTPDVLDVTMVQPDSNGQAVISLHAYEMAMVGRGWNQNGPWSYIGIPVSDIMIVSADYGTACCPSEGMIPVGVDVTVEELGGDYHLEATSRFTDSNPQQIRQYYRSPETFYFNNARNLDGSLNIQKVVENEEPSGNTYDLVVRLTDISDNIPLDYLYSGSRSGTISFQAVSTVDVTRTNTMTGQDITIPYTVYEATLSLGEGESITIDGLPSGADYEVTETAASSSGYTVSYTNGTGVITSGQTASVICTNTRITPTPSDTPSNTPTDTPASTPSVTSAATPSLTITDTPAVTTTDTPSVTPTDVPTVTPVLTSTVTPAVTSTDVPAVTPTDAATATPTASSTDVQTATPTASSTDVPTATPTATATPVPSVSSSSGSGTPSTGETGSVLIPAALVMMTAGMTMYLCERKSRREI